VSPLDTRRGAGIYPRVRVALAIALAGLVLLGAASPHEHDTALGTHACAACVTASSDEARSETPDLAPRLHPPVQLREPCAPAIATGAPLGAVPGQSPPRRAA
jgi:hypothetical protein